MDAVNPRLAPGTPQVSAVGVSGRVTGEGSGVAT